jgi:sensor histidine kinase YesM
MTVEQHKKANELIIKIGKLEHEVQVIRNYMEAEKQSPIRFGDNFNVSIPIDIEANYIFSQMCMDLIVDKKERIQALKQQFSNL